MRWINIYEEYRNVIYDSVKVKHIFRKKGCTRFYICQFSLKSEIDSIGQDFARRFYLVKTNSIYEKKPKRFDLVNGDIVRCFYKRSHRRMHFTLQEIVVQRSKETIYPHPCLKDKPLDIPLLTLYE